VRRTEAEKGQTTRNRGSRKPAIAIVGAGRLASFLVPALNASGYTISEIILRRRASRKSFWRARSLARKVGAKVVTIEKAALNASLLWFCVPDREIGSASAMVASRLPPSAEKRYAFHSSGTLLSDELSPLRKAGWAIVSVHPLMTFVEGRPPSLGGVPFALEGDPVATRLAQRIVRDLGGHSFRLSASRKAAYHAWATMTSPLLVAYLVTLEQVARQASLSATVARRMSAPIIRQTISNYGKCGPARSFSGPLIRGDVPTVAKHLKLLRKNPATREVYVALARIALTYLPTENRAELRRLLKD